MAAQRGNKWQARVRTPDKYWRPSFSTKAEAELWEARAKRAIALGEPVPDPSNFGTKEGMTLKAFVSKHADAIWSNRTNHKQSMLNCKGLVEYFGEDKLMSDITPLDYEGFVDHCKTDLRNSDRTINRKTSTLRMLLKKAKRLGYISDVIELEHRKEGRGRTRFLSEQEEQAILAAAKRFANPEVYARIVFMMDTGCRDSEVRRLQWDDITDGKVSFWMTKTDMPRTLPLTRRAQEALEWSKGVGNAQPFPMAYTTFLEAWRAILADVGLSKDKTLVPYTLRHSCATKLVRRGVDLRRVKDWMGHSNIQTTMIYAHLAPDDLGVCAEALEEA